MANVYQALVVTHANVWQDLVALLVNKILMSVRTVLVRTVVNVLILLATIHVTV